ncbi:hypothetical protein MMC31_001639 [Peltigera leucophlebia]|nr:hypothetical protein [Peltigera leucophlebia]
MASKIHLPFLRPLPIVRFYLTQSSLFSRQISASPWLQKDAVTAKKAPSELTPPQLPYHVYRTTSQQLPVYHIAKRGGNLHQTRIRKINGDVMKLREDIQKALELKEGNIAINPTTGHITIKGHLRNDVMKFLEKSGF